MRGFLRMARAAALGAGAAAGTGAATAGRAEVEAAGSSSSESLESLDTSDDEADEAELERLRFLSGCSASSGAGLADADKVPLCSLSLLRRARRLPNSPPPLPPPVTPSCGVIEPAVTKPLVMGVAALAPVAEGTPRALSEPTTAAALPRFMPMPSVSSLAVGIEAMRLEKTEPPLARMAACDWALPSVGADSGFQPIEARRRKPGALVSAGAVHRQLCRTAARVL